MEKQIIEIAKAAIVKSVTEELVGYNKPLSKLTQEVIAKHSDEISSFIDEHVTDLIKSDKFRDNIKGALNDRLAKTIVSKIGGEMEKKVNELKANPTTRAKITLAIDSIISEL